MHKREGEVVLERDEAGVVTSVVLNRPKKRNALSPAMLAELRAALDEAIRDRSRVILIRSAAEGVFCAGFDINYIESDQERAGAKALYDVFDAIEAANKVTVAFADGVVVGGGTELFLACDLRVATPRTTFRMTPVRLSVVYSLEGLARFVRAIGFTAAAELFLGAFPLTAEEALRVGLATRLLPTLDAVQAYCREVAAGAPQAQYAMKVMLRLLAEDIARPETSETQWRRLSALTDAARESRDREEALRAFAEKQSPTFTGR